MTAKYGGNGSNSLIYNAAAISMALYAMINCAVPVSGACLNPAVGIIQTAGQSIYLSTTKGTLPIYIFAPTLGGIFAGLFSVANESANKEMIDKNIL